MIRFIIRIAVILIALIPVCAPVGADTIAHRMGIGVLLPSSGFQRQGERSDQIEYLVPAGIILYNRPAGQRASRLEKSGENLIINTADDPITVDGRDILSHWEDRFTMALKIFAENGNYINILAHTREKGFWVKKSDIRKMRYGFKRYPDILLSLECTVYVITGTGLNLRKNPDIRAEKLVTIEAGFRFPVTLTGRVRGDWAEADVIELDKSPCDDGKELNRYRGWLKVVDNNGSPNIFYSDTGC